MREKLFRCSLIVLAALWMGFSSSQAHAFSVSPIRVEISLPAGGAYEGYYTVTNSTEDTISLDITLEDSTVGTKETGGDRLALEWLKIRPNKLLLAPGEAGEVEFAIAIPEDAHGEYIARISFESNPPPGGTPMAITSVISYSIYVAVEGTEKIEGDVVGLSIHDTDPLDVRITIKNSGNIHIRPKGEVIIQRRGRHRESGRGEVYLILNKNGFPVYPFSERTLQMKYQESITPGRYKAIVNMKFGPEVIRREFWFTVHKGGETGETRLRR